MPTGTITHPIPLFMNWSNVSVVWAIGTGTATTTNIAEIMSVQFPLNAAQEKFMGDNRRFARYIKNTEESRSVSITSGNVASMLAIPTNALCTVYATLNNAENNAGTGSITFTLLNAVRASQGPDGANNKFAMNTIVFNSFGDDSDTDPLSYVINS